MKAIRQLKENDARRPQAEKCLEILNRRIAQGAKTQGRHTEKSTALDEAKAQVQVCEEQQDSVEVAVSRAFATFQKKFVNIMHANRCNHDELANAAGRAIQTALELQYDDPDKELNDEPDFQDECKGTPCNYRPATEEEQAEAGTTEPAPKRRRNAPERAASTENEGAPGDKAGIGAQASDAADFVIAIPSYNRADQLFKKTYERILLPMGLTSKALVFLQTDEDARTYHEKFAGTDMGFVRAPEKGFAQVNHFIEHYFDIGAKVVVMHDDLRRILKLTTDQRKFQPLTEPSQVVEMFNLAFHSMQSNGLTLGGVLQTTNASWAPDKEVGLDLKFIYDPLHFIISTKEAPLCQHFHFDDLERTIYAYERDGGVVRLNRYAIDTPSEAYDPKAVGGLAGQRKFEEAQAAASVFQEEFKEFVGKFKPLKSGDGLRPTVKRLPFRPERNLAMVM
jgi:hypothetical protein